MSFHDGLALLLVIFLFVLGYIREKRGTRRGFERRSSLSRPVVPVPTLMKRANEKRIGLTKRRRTALPDEAKDMITCPVCLYKYHDVDGGRNPKLLPCYHTLCRKCLKVIKGTISLTCPLCRKVYRHSGDVNLFPNNQYAICIMQMSKDIGTDMSLTSNIMHKLTWCLTCKSITSLACTSHHPTVDMSSEILTSFEALPPSRKALPR